VGVARRAGAAVAGLLLALVVASPAHAETVRQGQWWLDSLHVDQVQKISTGQGVTVAVIDGTGVDADHPDLEGQVLPGTSIGINSPDGWSTLPDGTHATAVAGIIAAKGGGDMHALGIAPGAKILPVAIPHNSSGTEVAQGIRWAAEHGAKVINLSVGLSRDATPAEVDAVRYALDRDVVVVAAAGNIPAGDQRVVAPANIPGVVAVSGVDQHAQFWTGSVSGPEVVISAPAVAMVSLAERSQYRSGYSTGDGTSFAAPIVAATAALIRSKYPSLNAANVINRLIATAKDQGTPGRDPQYGFGTIRVLNALNTDVPQVNANPLGVPSASQDSSAPAAQVSPGEGFPVGLVVASGVGLLLLLIVIVVVIVAVSGGKRRPPPPPRYPPGQPPPRGPPYGPPPGWRHVGDPTGSPPGPSPGSGGRSATGST
jgi:type VII secretion-associated serine protease mycosin